MIFSDRNLRYKRGFELLQKAFSRSDVMSENLTIAPCASIVSGVEVG